ncbi:uncharacterized mitochondrial protein AtMg00820-like [Hevea brasiliensis]|uniref:uncharacterized mitochondrial protein AtMg00820-like n=1 Tax=Hevea brasiliensis TaxID=3981 RepID=UPI0025F1F167|nr:uncharacterized mitochondrial protein AtMg00820-like [Hevea brasiliensis]
MRRLEALHSDPSLISSSEYAVTITNYDPTLDLPTTLCKDSIHIPKTVKALSHPSWCAAMKEEIEALDINGTWKLVPLAIVKKVIGCKWVFTVKMNLDGSIARLKARLIAKKHMGLITLILFSPIAKLASIQLFISLLATYDYPLHQLDIKNAFLHANL